MQPYLAFGAVERFVGLGFQQSVLGGFAGIGFAYRGVGGCRCNRLDTTEGWNFLMRIYRPGKSVLEGAYKLPAAKPAKMSDALGIR